ncbi:MAG: TIGR01459 family HAD-type hydrolase [Opitutales bacterium]
MEDVVIGVDLGTSGVRAVAMDRHGRLMGAASRRLPGTVAEGMRRLQDPQAWWTGLGECLRELVRSTDGCRPRAIAVDGTSGTLLAIDHDHRPVGLARMYDDADTRNLAEIVARLAPAESAARGPTSAAARALQLASSPGVVRVVHQADWIMLRLGAAEAVTDENNALKTGYDPVARRWPSWLGELGLSDALLPKVLPAGTAVGRIDADVALEIGLPPDVTLVTGTTDGCAGFLASGASRIGDATTSLGSTLVLKVLGDRPVFSPAHGVYSHRIGDRWLIGGASNCGGRTLLAHFTTERMSELEGAMDASLPTGHDYYPLPSPGERFPHADATMQPRLSPRPAKDPEFLQGILEGLTKVEAAGYARLHELGGPRLRTVRHLGGGTRSRTWMALRARALDAPCLAALDEEAAAGTARLAWTGMGHEVPTEAVLKQVDGLSSLRDYDVLLVDQFGTLHDGTHPYPGAAEALRNFRAGGGKVIVVSNSAKPGTDNLARLRSMGFGSGEMDAVVTSGDVARQALSDGSLGAAFSGRKAHLSGRPGETYGLETTGLAWTAPEDCDFVIIAASREPMSSWKTQLEELLPALRRGVSFLVINPDVEMLTPGGVRPSAGAIGRALADRGGKVVFLGKPGREIYRAALGAAGVRPSRRVLVMGDSPEHDIFGASAAGLSGMLVRTGIMTTVKEDEIRARLPLGEWLVSKSLRP